MSERSRLPHAGIYRENVSDERGVCGYQSLCVPRRGKGIPFHDSSGGSGRCACAAGLQSDERKDSAESVKASHIEKKISRTFLTGKQPFSRLEGDRERTVRK